MEQTMIKNFAVAALAAATLSAIPAFAQKASMPSWYIGGGFGVGSLNKSGSDLTGLANASIDDSDTTYTIRGGYRFHPNFAAEIGYYDLGSYTFSGMAGSTAVSGSAKAKSYGISLVAIAPIQEFDLYARIGWEESEIKANANTTLSTASESDRQSGATYGVGGRWNFTKNWGVFAEWMKNDKIEVDSYLFGVDYRF
jgi:OOP family OmpA-OmpF porin